MRRANRGKRQMVQQVDVREGCFLHVSMQESLSVIAQISHAAPHIWRTMARSSDLADTADRLAEAETHARRSCQARVRALRHALETPVVPETRLIRRTRGGQGGRSRGGDLGTWAVVWSGIRSWQGVASDRPIKPTAEINEIAS